MANTKPIYDNVTISFRRICRWALWFSDISVLSSYAALPDQTMLANVERNVNPSQVAYDVPGIWAGKIPYLQELVPEQTAREDWALDWDRFKCVLTKFVYGLDVSHIVPLKVNKITVKEQEQEWTLLGLVWSKERVNRWREAMMTGESHEAGMVTERLENLITLDAPVHIFWAMLNVLFILSRSTRIRPIWKFLSTGCLVLGL
ncbi:hypothetical protein AAEP93_009794 [Penicillium crustosum]